jgi:hypothetical protein
MRVRQEKMRKKLLPAERLRLKILESLYKLWKMRPGPDQFFSLQEVWKEIYTKLGNRVDNYLAEGVLESLQDERLIEIRVNSKEKSNENSVIRITRDGRHYINKYRAKKITLIIAIITIIIGILKIIK